MDKVLIVEDDQSIRELLELKVQELGYQPEGIESAARIEDMLDHNQYRLFILDWMLPGLSGVEIIKILKNSKEHMDTPILMVTAKATNEDLVYAMETGADDYIFKPFDTDVFSVRVKSLIRRTDKDQKSKNPGILRNGPFEINKESHEALIDGNRIDLTISEFKLLENLVQNSGKVMTRTSLIDKIQGSDVSVIDRTIDTHIFGLRKKMGEYKDWIETIRGVGYRMRNH